MKYLIGCRIVSMMSPSVSTLARVIGAGCLLVLVAYSQALPQKRESTSEGEQKAESKLNPSAGGSGGRTGRYSGRKVTSRPGSLNSFTGHSPPGGQRATFCQSATWSDTEEDCVTAYHLAGWPPDQMNGSAVGRRLIVRGFESHPLHQPIYSGFS